MTDFATINAGQKAFARDFNKAHLPASEIALVDEALFALSKLRDSFVWRDQNGDACRVDELIERLTAIARGQLRDTE